MKDQVTTLNEIVPNVFLQMDANKDWSVAPNDSLDGWYDVNSRYGSIGAGKIFVYQNEIDVSGWGNQGLSFFPIQAGVQEGGNYTYLIDDSLQVIDVISDSPLDAPAYIFNNALSYPNITLPALYERTLDLPAARVFPPLGWENVLYGNSRLFQHNNNLQGLLVLPVNTNDFGSMNPTASDKLYLTRIVICETSNSIQTGGVCYIPPARFIIKGMLKSESDLSYIYRLKDSFKTSQTDVGYNGL